MERHVLIGRYTDQRGQHLTHNVNVRVELKEKEPHHENPADRKPVISISGDCNGHGGQCQDEMRRLLDRITWAPGWSHDRALQLLDIWDRWHLNDMQAGCEHQRADGWDKASKDMIGNACPTCGYKYGSAWLYEQPPPEVLAFVEKIIRDDLCVSGRSALEDFITKHRITSKATELRERADAADWPAGTRHYRVELTGPAGVTMRVTYSMGPAHTKRPTTAEVLRCVGHDVTDLGGQSFESWARSIGLDVDSRKAHRTYETILRQRDDLKAMMGHLYASLLALCEVE